MGGVFDGPTLIGVDARRVFSCPTATGATATRTTTHAHCDRRERDTGECRIEDPATDIRRPVDHQQLKFTDQTDLKCFERADSEALLHSKH
jgi:hypothetical protein